MTDSGGGWAGVRSDFRRFGSPDARRVQADTGSPSATYGDASYKSATYGKVCRFRGVSEVSLTMLQDVKHVDYDVSQKRGPPGGGGGGGGGGRAH